MTLLDKTGQLLTASLRVLGRRHALLAANAANVETPGYLRADVDFAAALRVAIETGAGERPGEAWVDRAAAIEPYVLLDGNGADLELEMAEVARNSLQMMAVSTLVSMKLEHLRSAITEGRR